MRRHSHFGGLPRAKKTLDVTSSRAMWRCDAVKSSETDLRNLQREGQVALEVLVGDVDAKHVPMTLSSRDDASVDIRDGLMHDVDDRVHDNMTAQAVSRGSERISKHKQHPQKSAPFFVLVRDLHE